VRWFVRHGGALVWADSPETLRHDYPGTMPLSFAFVPARLEDNPILNRADPGYLAKLLALPLVERERLLGGNWKVRPAAGKVFNRSWFEVVDAVPAGGEECRFWDLAATERKLAGDDPDFTAGVRIRKQEGVYFVTDVTAVQQGPAAVERLILETARRDRDEAKANGARHRVRWEIEPGAASRLTSHRLIGLLDGHDAAGVVAQGDKITRARALAAQAEAGNVKLLRGPWNEQFLQHMHAVPDGPHDDIMDAAAGSYNALHGKKFAIWT
jgi:predicted phage terminase large subunit-like protein